MTKRWTPGSRGSDPRRGRDSYADSGLGQTSPLSKDGGRSSSKPSPEWEVGILSTSWSLGRPPQKVVKGGSSAGQGGQLPKSFRTVKK